MEEVVSKHLATEEMSEERASDAGLHCQDGRPNEGGGGDSKTGGEAVRMRDGGSIADVDGGATREHECGSELRGTGTGQGFTRAQVGTNGNCLQLWVESRRGGGDSGAEGGRRGDGTGGEDVNDGRVGGEVMTTPAVGDR